MNIDQLRIFLDKNLIYPHIVNINSELNYVNGTFNIELNLGKWRVYHFERGTVSLEREFIHERDAVEYLISLLKDYNQIKKEAGRD